MKVDVGKSKSVTIYRERPATAAEKRKDRDARVMAECVTVTFGDNEPTVVVNRNLCGE